MQMFIQFSEETSRRVLHAAVGSFAEGVVTVQPVYDQVIYGAYFSAEKFMEVRVGLPWFNYSHQNVW